MKDLFECIGVFFVGCVLIVGFSAFFIAWRERFHITQNNPRLFREIEAYLQEERRRRRAH